MNQGRTLLSYAGYCWKEEKLILLKLEFKRASAWCRSYICQRRSTWPRSTLYGTSQTCSSFAAKMELMCMSWRRTGMFKPDIRDSSPGVMLIEVSLYVQQRQCNIWGEARDLDLPCMVHRKHVQHLLQRLNWCLCHGEEHECLNLIFEIPHPAWCWLKSPSTFKW